jgi:hypothetical protein
MKPSIVSTRSGLLAAAFTIASASSAWAVDYTATNGFEFDTGGWTSATRVASGTDGISSAAGGFHAKLASGSFTRWGGYKSIFPAGGFTTSVRFYLNPAGGWANDTRFSFTSAVSNISGAHLRDFGFNAGFYNDAVGPGAGTNRILVNVSNNVGRGNSDPKDANVIISTAGWYTFEHSFQDNGSGVLAVTLTVRDSSNAVVGTPTTLSTPADLIGTVVGGNRYGWLQTNEFPGGLPSDGGAITSSAFPSIANLTQGTYHLAISSAVGEATPADVIGLGAGSYSEGSLTLNKALTLQGPNAGVAGAATRVAEARISDSAWTVTAAGVVIDGLEIYQTNNTTSPVSIQASNVTVSNSVIKREGVDAGQFVRGIEISPGLAGYSIAGNLITGSTSGGLFGGHKTWNSGMYVNGGSGSISGNTFENCRSAINLDDFNGGISVTGNSFRNSGTYISFGGVSPTTGSYAISGNDFDFNLAAPALPSAFLNNSNVAPTFRIDATGNTFGGTATAALSDANKFAIEARMVHRGRGSKNGVIDYSAGEQVVVAGTTIASAIDAASAGHTVLVGPGTYAETLSLSKSLTLRGPNHLISPNTGVRAAEAVLTGSISANTSVSSTFVIEGLRFATASPLTSNGNAPGTIHNDFTFRRNIVDSGSAQVALFTGTPTNTASALIEDNRFLAMSGNAMQLAAGPGSLQATISNNVVDGTGFAGINSDGLTNSTISGNSFANTFQQGVQVAGPSSNVMVTGNVFTNANTSNGADRGAVRVYGTTFTGPVHVTGNVITGGNTAFAVRNGEAIAGKDILFTGNSMSGVAGDAVYHGGTGTLDATGNYWGDEDGPAGNPGTVTGAVQFNPWYGASNHAFPLSLSDLRTGILVNTVISGVQANLPNLYIAPGTTVTVTPTGGLDVTELELADGATLIVEGGELVIGDGSKISGNFTIFNSFGSWDINGDTTFEIGQSLALITDIHVAAGKTLTVNGGGELLLDGCVVDSQTPGSPYFIEVEDDGLLTLVRSVVSDAQIDIDTLASSVPANLRSRVFDNRFTASDVEASADSKVFHNLFDAATNGAANTDLSAAFAAVDGWSNVTSEASLQNTFSLEFAAPVNPTRTLDAGNLFVQSADPVVLDMKVASLGANTVIAAEALLGYNSNLLTLVSPTPAVSPESGWSVIVDDDSIDGALGLVDSAVGLNLVGPGNDGISADTTIAKVNFTADAPGITVGFFRAQTNGEFNPDGSFVKDTRLTKSALGLPSFLSSFTANSGELVIDDQDPTIATPAVSGTQVQPSVLTPVDVLAPASRVLRNGTPVILTFTATDTGLAGLDALDASDDLVLTADNGVTLLNSSNYSVSASESLGVVTYTVTLTVPVTATTGTYAVQATVLDRSGNQSPVALLGSFVIANEAIATVELQSFGATTRDVTFVATNGGGSVLATWTKTITNFSGGIGSVALENVPAGTAAISAKTAWTLRSKVPASFSLQGVGAVSLTGVDLLKAGDLTGDNVVNTLDYSVLRFNWLTMNAVADITGDGLVQAGDYNPLQANFYTVGDPQ